MIKPIPLSNEIFLWLWSSLLLWGNAYLGQRDIIKHPAQFKGLRIQVPGIIALLCGKPSRDNYIEISRMVSQLGALLMSVLWLPLILMQISFLIRMRVFVYSIVFVLLLGTLGKVVSNWWAKR